MEGRDQILLAVGRLEGKVDAVLSHQRRQDSDTAAQEKRIRNLEQARAWLIGACAVAGFAASYIPHFLLK